MTCRDNDSILNEILESDVEEIIAWRKKQIKGNKHSSY